MIPTIGRRELVTRALPSVVSQSRKFNEVLLVCDRPDAVLSAATKILRSADARWRILRTEGGAGGPAARKLGFSMGDGEYAVFLDDDDALASDFVEKLCATLESCPKTPSLVIPTVQRVWSEGCIPPSPARRPRTESSSPLVPSAALFSWGPATSSGLVVSTLAFGELPIDARIEGFNDVQLVRNISAREVPVAHARESIVFFYQYFTGFRMTSDIEDRLKKLAQAKKHGMRFPTSFEQAVRVNALLSHCRTSAYRGGLRGLYEALSYIHKSPEHALLLRVRPLKYGAHIIISLWLCATRWIR